MNLPYRKICSIYNPRGMTLIEILAAITISMICLTVLLQLTLNNRTHKTEIDRSMIFKDVLTNNAIEIKGSSSESLPSSGTCLIRTYNFAAEFQQEVTATTVANLCGAPEPARDAIQVIWQIEGSDTIDATFSSPNLKMPRYSNTLKKVTLHVRGFSSGASARLIHDQVSLFKK